MVVPTLSVASCQAVEFNWPVARVGVGSRWKLAVGSSGLGDAHGTFDAVKPSPGRGQFSRSPVSPVVSPSPQISDALQIFPRPQPDRATLTLLLTLMTGRIQVGYFLC